MAYVDSYTNEELFIITDENKLVKLKLDGYNAVIYSELINGEWNSYPAVFAKDLMSVVDPNGVTFEDKMTIDYFTCHFFNHWYSNIVNKD